MVWFLFYRNKNIDKLNAKQYIKMPKKLAEVVAELLEELKDKLLGGQKKTQLEPIPIRNK